MTQKIAIVTGASRGLGAALAEALAPDYHVIAVARTVGALEELDDRIRAKGGTTTLAPMDVAQGAAMQELARGIADRWGRLDLWAHTAIHAPPLTPAGQIAAKDWATCLNVNVTATASLIGLLGPLLVNTECARALFFDDPRAGERYFGAYGASKAAQIALARSWQAEAARLGPAVEIRTPDPMPTATRARFFPGEDKSTLADPRQVARQMLGAGEAPIAPA